MGVFSELHVAMRCLLRAMVAQVDPPTSHTDAADLVEARIEGLLAQPWKRTSPCGDPPHNLIDSRPVDGQVLNDPLRDELHV